MTAIVRSRFHAVLFDIDNVLVDTRASYTDCIRKTVETYLVQELKFKSLKPVRARSIAPLLTRRDVEQFKSLGGFNDDWDTCYGLLMYLLSLPVRERSLKELHKRKNIPKWVRSIKERPVGMKGLEKCLTTMRHCEESLMGRRSNLKAQRLLRFARNDGWALVSFPRIPSIFQRLYLGEFVWNERLLIPRSLLKRLKRAGIKIGIVTGRNREEAFLALKRFRIDSLIDAIVTTDETPKNKKKPHPYGLLKIAQKLGTNLRYLYVGDLPDDILAAKAASKKINIRSVGFLAAAIQPAEMKRALKKAGADFVRAKPKDLVELILSTK